MPRINRKQQRIDHFNRSMELIGITPDDRDALRRIELALHRWSERECNGEVERDEATNKTYAVYGQHGPGKIHRVPTADKESGALKRLAMIMSRYPKLVAYHQGDPRGCALYIIEKEKLGARDIDSCYSSGLAVCY